MLAQPCPSLYWQGYVFTCRTINNTIINRVMQKTKSICLQLICLFLTLGSFELLAQGGGKRNCQS